VPDSTVSSMLLGWSATRMGGMLTRVARWLAVMNGTPSVAIGSCEKVPPLCVTVISACASRKVAAEKTLWQGYRSLWLDSEDATYMVALTTVC
jgi:hypothetical protein